MPPTAQKAEIFAVGGITNLASHRAIERVEQGERQVAVGEGLAANISAF